MPTSRRTPLALALTVALLGGGCGTMDNVKRPTHAHPSNPDASVCRVYGGVRGDWALISEYPLSQTTVYVDYVAIPMLAGINLFFSAIGDTITLPYTTVEEARRAFGLGKPSSEFTPVVTPVVAVADTAPPAKPTAAQFLMYRTSWMTNPQAANSKPTWATTPKAGVKPGESLPISTSTPPPPNYFSTVNR